MIPFSGFSSSILKVQPKSALVDLETRFSKGELIKGTVIKNLGKDGALIRLKGLDLVASTPKTLTKGESLLVTVEELKPNLKVSLLINETAKEAKAASLLRFYLPQAKPVGELLSELTKLLSKIPKSILKGSEIEEVLAKLSKGVKGGKEENLLKLFGLSHEADIASGKPSQNLKMSLLLLIQKLENLPEKDLEKFRAVTGKLKKVLQNIELRQFVNSDDGKNIKEWELPFWNGEKLSSVKLFVEGKKKREKKGKRGDITKLTILLDMSNIGSVRIDARSSSKEVVGSIYVEDREVQTEVEKALPDLIKGLKSVGFSGLFDVAKGNKKFLLEPPEGDEQFLAKSLLNVKA